MLMIARPVLYSIIFCICIACTKSRRQPGGYPKAKCFVADTIFDHVPVKTWWWQSDLRNIHVRPTFKGFSKKWKIYVNYIADYKTAVIEFAHKTHDGRCRFLMRKTRKFQANFVGLTRPMKCQDGINGDKTLFPTSLKNLSNEMHRYRSIRAIADDKKFYAGYNRRKRMLTLSKFRSEDAIAWWEIDLTNKSPCPERR